MAVISGDTLRMPGKRSEDNQNNEYSQSYNAMLKVLDRYYELTGDVEIKRIVDTAKQARARR